MNILKEVHKKPLKLWNADSVDDLDIHFSRYGKGRKRDMESADDSESDSDIAEADENNFLSSESESELSSEDELFDSPIPIPKGKHGQTCADTPLLSSPQVDSMDPYSPTEKRKRSPDEQDAPPAKRQSPSVRIYTM
jgi:hypothetical protein